MNNLRVLLVEDDIILGELMAEILRDFDFDVTWFVRAANTEGVVVLTDVDNKHSALDGREYDVALVDGQLKGSKLNGWDLTPLLVKMKLPVIALSGDPGINRTMIGLGATTAIRKDHIRLTSEPGIRPPNEIVLEVARRRSA